MQKFTHENRRSRASRFSLIEIMVVLAIMALAAGLAVPAVMSKLEWAKYDTTRMQVGQLQGVIEMFYMDMNRYPQNLDELLSNPGDTKWRGPYVKDAGVLVDKWGNDLHYETPGPNNHPFDVVSYAKDNSPGGEGLDADISCWSTDGK